MKCMMVAASHSPLLDFPARESASVLNIYAGIDAARGRITAFDPELVVFFGVDHYGGQHMASMPSFCVGVEAEAIDDVGGTPGRLNVPRELAIEAVSAIRKLGVDTAASYAMEVDHGFSQALSRFTGGVATYPVLPIFMSCIQIPFSPYARGRALGEAVGRFVQSLKYERVLFMGTGGLAHDPSGIFPPIDVVSERWRPYILHGNAQTEVDRQAWIDWEIAVHKRGAVQMAGDDVHDYDVGIRPEWDETFLDTLCAGDLTVFDNWDPEQVMATAGIGAVETQTWVAAAQAMQTVTGAVPTRSLYAPSKEVGLGYGIVQAGPAPAL
jgi:2,3-dihydroxyphenylpropionate 1,2-dioxygenase